MWEQISTRGPKLGSCGFRFRPSLEMLNFITFCPRLKKEPNKSHVESWETPNACTRAAPRFTCSRLWMLLQLVCYQKPQSTTSLNFKCSSWDLLVVFKWFVKIPQRRWSIALVWNSIHFKDLWVSHFEPLTMHKTIVAGRTTLLCTINAKAVNPSSSANLVAIFSRDTMWYESEWRTRDSKWLLWDLVHNHRWWSVRTLPLMWGLNWMCNFLMSYQ